MKNIDKIIQAAQEIIDLCEKDWKEELGKKSHCPKCGDEVKGDTDGYCSNCV